MSPRLAELARPNVVDDRVGKGAPQDPPTRARALTRSRERVPGDVPVEEALVEEALAHRGEDGP